MYRGKVTKTDLVKEIVKLNSKYESKVGILYSYRLDELIKLYRRIRNEAK